MILLFCLLNTVVLSSCQRVVITSSDELISRSWQCETLSGIFATIEFYTTQATFTVYDTKGKQEAQICGALTIDSEHFYITDSNLKKTYSFGYKVYTDRAEITYMEEMLNFYPVNQMEETTSQ